MSHYFRVMYGVTMAVRWRAIMVHPQWTGHNREIWAVSAATESMAWPQCVNSRLICCVNTGEDSTNLLICLTTNTTASYHTAHYSRQKSSNTLTMYRLRSNKDQNLTSMRSQAVFPCRASLPHWMHQSCQIKRTILTESQYHMSRNPPSDKWG